MKTWFTRLVSAGMLLWVVGMAPLASAEDAAPAAAPATVEEAAPKARRKVVAGHVAIVAAGPGDPDLLTLRERFGTVRDLRIAYVGDGNNVARSWVEAAVRFGFTLRLPQIFKMADAKNDGKPFIF